MVPLTTTTNNNNTHNLYPPHFATPPLSLSFFHPALSLSRYHSIALVSLTPTTLAASLTTGRLQVLGVPMDPRVPKVRFATQNRAALKV